MKKNIKLEDLKLESFLAELNDEKSKEIIGGRMTAVDVRTSIEGCPEPTTYGCPPATATCGT